MARIKKHRGTGAAAQNAGAAGKGEGGDGNHDAIRETGAGSHPAKTDARRKNDWEAAKERLTKLESPNNGVCRVRWPDAVGELWNGVYGNAKIETGDPEATTADGKRHPL